MTIILAIFQFFIGSNLGRLLGVGLIGLVSTGLAYSGGRISGYNKGYQAAINKIAAQDQEAVGAADQASKTRMDCINQRKQWHVEDGTCS